MQYSTILFDLDGTLTDPQVGISKSFQYALSKMGIIENDPATLLSFIGPPIRDSFRNYFLEPEKIEETFVHYTDYYAKKGVYEAIVYPGITELLEQLTKNKKLFVATSKTEFYAKETIRHFGLGKYFEAIVGPFDDGRRSTKKEVIEAIMKQYQVPYPQAVMVGDRMHDIEGARLAGIDSIAVGYGFGSVEELKKAKPTHIAATIDDLESLLVDI